MLGKRFGRLCAIAAALTLLLTGAAAQEADYQAAMALYEAGDYEQAIAAFEALGDYEDSRKMLANSRWYWKEQRYESAMDLYRAESYAQALALFEELGSFEDSRQYANKCRRGLDEQTWEAAEALYAQGSLEEARALYAGLDDDRSQSRVEAIDAEIAAQEQAAYEQECYDQALALKAEGRLAEARDLFIQAAGVEGATDRIYEILPVLALDEVYDRAVADMGYGRYEDAIVRFETLGDHRDSAQKAAEAREALSAQRYAEAGQTDDPSRARILFLALGEYRDSAARAEALQADTGIATLYRAAQALKAEKRCAEAAVGFDLCENYNGSDDLADEMRQTAQNEAQFQRAHILTDLWRLEEANAIYDSLGHYSYASRMGIERITALQLRDDATSPMSETFTAPDGTTHRYRLFKGVTRWVEAEAFCRALGGHLATLTTEEENSFVHAFMWDSGFTTAYFGLEDEERDRTWEWVTGEPVEYLNWHSGEPSYSARERYGMYFYKHTQGTWNDAHFYEHAEEDPGCSFICEWDD